MKIVKVLEIPKTLPKHSLPTNIVDHCNIYKEEIMRHASLFAWISLSKYIDLTEVRFSKNGKPYLVGNRQYFSLSHSHEVIAIAISDKPIGIDIENILPGNIASLLASRLLAGKNLESYYKAKDRALWFTKYWTQHEAYLKLKDNQLNFKNLKQSIKGNISTKLIKSGNKQYVISTIVK